MTVELYCGDCLEILPTLAAGSVDAVITDPPYGIGENGKKNLSRSGFSTEKWTHPQARNYGDYNWDVARKTKELQAILDLCSSAVIFGGNYYTDILPPSMGWIVWDKLNSGDFADCEMVWTSQKRAARMFRYMWNGMIKQEPEERYHPTQKPLKLMTWILENYTTPGDTILDPFMGSGTTGVACVQTGRNFIGIEIDPNYFAIAEKRIKQAELQIRMEM